MRGRTPSVSLDRRDADDDLLTGELPLLHIGAGGLADEGQGLGPDLG